MPDNIVPDNAAPAPPENPASPQEAASGAIRTLRLLLVGTIVVPLLLAAVGGYLSYRAACQRAAAALAEAVAVAVENTTKILDTHVLVAARIGDLLLGKSDAELQAQEKTLHQRIAEQIADLPQVAAAWVIDADGRELASARVFPVDRGFDNSGREDFRALKDGANGTYIQALRARSLSDGDYRPYFTVSQRRNGPDGGFDGIIVVAVSGPYFASFYNALLGGSAQYSASVLRDDGTTLARYPATAQSAAGQEDELLAKAIAGKTAAGVIAGGSVFGGEGSLVAYKRLASYPVYVAIGQTNGSILYEWLETMAGYAAVGVPAAIGLMLLSLMALRRTRREQLALAAARDATAERAAIEAQLHQAQKMEAVGLLTAGIAHDFNNLLTVVAGNIALLEARPDADDAKRRRFIAAASDGCERASALTKRLLGFARREPVDPRQVAVNEVISGLSDLPWRSLGDRITVEFRLAKELWPVFVDPSQLENALLNLAINARDAMGTTGRLTIETSNVLLEDADLNQRAVAAGEYVAIFVGDTGAGMTPEVRNKAFDPFFTTKADGKGSGLGLAQVNGFITRSGGYCAIESEPGRGTIVKLYLPRYIPTAERGEADAAPDDAARPAARAAAK